MADSALAELRVACAAAVPKLEEQVRVAEDRTGKADEPADDATRRADGVLAEIKAPRAELAKPWWRPLFR